MESKQLERYKNNQRMYNALVKLAKELEEFNVEMDKCIGVNSMIRSSSSTFLQRINRENKELRRINKSIYKNIQDES